MVTAPELTLRQLQYFVVVAEELHFTRAAARLGMAQPPLSQQIQRLEGALGAELFERRPSVKLTAAGRALLPGARLTLRHVEQIVREARRAGSGETGTLRLAFPSSAVASPVPAAARAFRVAAPDVHLTLLELSTAEQTQALREGAIDLGFMRQPHPDPDLVIEVEYAESLILACPADHPVAKRRKVALSKLQGEPFILFPREVSPGLFDQVHQLMAASGVKPRVVQEAREWVTVLALVAAGEGLCLIPDSFRRMAWDEVRYLDVEPSLRTAVALCRSRARYPAVARRFVECARNEAR